MYIYELFSRDCLFKIKCLFNNGIFSPRSHAEPIYH